MLIQLLAIFLGWLAWWIYNDRIRYSKSPPGPLRVPLIGNIVQILLKSATFPARAFKGLSEIHGDIMFVKMGPVEAVVFSSFDAIKEILSHESASDRVQHQFVQDRHSKKNLGVVWGTGKPWHNLRRFTVRNLRDFGFGKTSQMDAVIIEEFEKFAQHIKNQANQGPDNVLHVEDLFSLTVLNVLWRLVSGKAYEYNDHRMIKLIQLNNDFFKSTNMGFDLSDCYPVLRDWFPHWSGRTSQIKTSQDLSYYGKELLKEHKDRGTYKNELNSFLDVFRAKVENSKDDPETDFTEEQFLFTILDLMIAGSETSSKTLTFGILYMLLYPEIQGKVQAELDREVPKGQSVDSTMKSKLPYTAATVLEIYRFSTIAPTPPLRSASEDFHFRGYHIKKGTSLIYNVHAVHFSEKLWGDPHNFRPERFLNGAGTEINQKLADQLLIFGGGKRICLGQSLAEASIFIYFASAMRRFQFVQVEGTNPTTEPIVGVSLAPQPFKVRILERCQ